MRAFNLKSHWQVAQQRRQQLQQRRAGANADPGGTGLQRRLSRFFPPDRTMSMRRESQLVVESAQLREYDEVDGKIGPPAAQVDQLTASRRRKRGARSHNKMSTMMPNILQNIRVIVPHVLLYSSTVMYTLFGAIVFHRLELPFEIEHLSTHSAALSQAQDTLLGILDANEAIFESYLQNAGGQRSGRSNSTVATEDEVRIRQLNETVNQAIDNIIYHAMNAYSEGIRAEELNHMRQLLSDGPNSGANANGIGNRVRPKWNFHSSLFFATTLLTSIGYGNLTPISPFGRLFCIAYAFLGIPLTLITIADVAKFLADLLMNAAAKWRRHIRDGYECRFRHRRMGLQTEKGVPAPGNNVKAGEERDDDGEVKDEAEDDVAVALFQPGFWTKLTVVTLLFAYMALTALAFSNIQENWDFLDSLYFCLAMFTRAQITLVTIGFGDFCPTSEDHYGWWILFIFAGLILSTLTVDLVGSSYIEKIHTLGRQLDFSAFLSVLGKGGADSARLLHRLYAGAYIPSDLKLIPYIDQHMQQYNNYYYLHQQQHQQTQMPEKHAPKKCSLPTPSSITNKTPI